MERIAITGGKGGTGKSTVATALAYALSKEKKVLLADADADCPNDHLLLDTERKLVRKICQRIPEFDLTKCTKCGRCGDACKPKAIVAVKGKAPIFLQRQCNGCGACRIACTDNAINWEKKEVGKIFKATKENLSLISGELNTGEVMSELIVKSLNDEIEKLEDNFDYIIIDTAAGAHCPVISAIEKADRIITVTEPTPLGEHDLEVILSVIKKLGKEGDIIINRSGIGDESGIEKVSESFGARILMRIPYSRKIVDAYARSVPIEIKDLEKAVEK